MAWPFERKTHNSCHHKNNQMVSLNAPINSPIQVLAGGSGIHIVPESGCARSRVAHIDPFSALDLSFETTASTPPIFGKVFFVFLCHLIFIDASEVSTRDLKGGRAVHGRDFVLVAHFLSVKVI